MDPNGGSRDDRGIMDLFRDEAERNAAAIRDGLTAIRKTPGSLEGMDAVIRAANRIRGGAQIVDLAPAVNVARAMEGALASAQRGDLALKENVMDTLLHGVDMLLQIACSAQEPGWIASHEAEIDGLTTAINGLSSPAAGPESKASTVSAGTSPPEDKTTGPGPRAVHPEKPGAIDPAMLELFKTEVQNHVATLNDGLIALEKGPDNVMSVEPLIRAARSIRGAARIVGSNAAARVSQALEECLTDAGKGAFPLDSNRVRTLLQGIDILNRVIRATDAAGLESVDLPQVDVDDLAAAIDEIRTQGRSALAETPRSGVPVISAGPVPRPERAVVEGASDLVDSTMLDMFQAEVETHVAVLNDGLIALESNPGATDQLEALMRAAHSIKGGARVLGLDVAVRAAHVMEDCFVAAQKGEVSLGPDQIDILLRIVDILTQLAHALSDGETDWLGRHREEIDRLVAAISAIINGEKQVYPVETQAEEAQVLPTEPLPGALTAPQALQASLPAASPGGETLPETVPHEDRDRTVRVTAGKIERLMGQAGEVVVNARWLPAFSNGLLELKRNHGELLVALDRFQETFVREKGGPEASELLAEVRAKAKECNRSIGERFNQFDVFNSTSAALSDRLYHEVISVKMRPFSDGVQRFPRLVRDIARDLGKKVRLEVKGKSTEVDRDILEKLDAPLNHLIRNALDHGIESPEERVQGGKPETGSLRLEAAHRSGMLMITIADDGRGIDPGPLRRRIVERGLAGEDMVEKMSEPELMDFLFLPGFTTARNVTEISGRGVGLDVVRTMVHDVGGVVRAVSRPGEGTTFQMELPLTLSVVRTFLVEIAGEPYAFPLARIERCLEIPRSGISTVEDRQYFRFDDANIALVDIHHVLELNTPPLERNNLFVVVVSDRLNFYGLSVDRFIGEYDLVVRPLDFRLGKVPDIGSVAVMLDGSPVLIFDVEDLVRSIDNLLTGRRLRKLSRETADAARPKKRILVVDDSFTVRETERKLLEGRGYEVETAVDGVDGWNAVRAARYDMVVSDVDMPRMNGVEFIRQIKQHPELKSLPVVIVSYKDKEEDRILGLEAGADYYLTKGSFEDDSLIRAAMDLIGEA